MAKRRTKPVTDYGVGSYPSLGEHRASRRRFLVGTAACVGAGALATACPGLFPGSTGGVMEVPDYHQRRLPETGDRAVYLVDGGYARFYAIGLTYYEDVALFLEDDRARLTDLLADELAAFTYDHLATPTGIAAVESQLRVVLDAAYNENTGDVGSDWLAEVQLNLTRLDAPEIMGGIAPSEPSYP